MEEHERHDKEPIILTSPARMAKGLIIVGVTLAIGAAVLVVFFDEMIANPPPVALIRQPGPPPPPPPPPQAGTTTIAILSGASVQGSPDYDPDNAQVPLGNKIVWRNDDTAFHTSTSGTGTEDPNNAALFDTGLINAGASSDPIELEGVNVGDVIDYYCFVHPFMTAKITITEASTGGAPPAGGPPAGPTVNILAGSATQGAPDYDPDSITVKKGDKVSVVNQDNTMHTITSGTGAEDPNFGKLFDTKFMDPGASATIDTASLDPATYEYFCLVHPYMKGTLVVE
jgi:plastocyanin